MAPFWRRRRRPSGPTSAETAAALPGELSALGDDMSHKAAHLPQDVNAQWDRVRTALRSIVGRPEQLAASADKLFVVSRSIRDYVPTSVAAYLALPAGQGDVLRVRSGRTAHEELAAQMALLADELERIERAGVAGDLQSLEDHGRFLEDKFGESDLRAT